MNIAFGQPAIWKSSTVFEMAATRLGSSRAILCYKDMGRGGRGVVRVVQMTDEGNLSFGDEVEFSSETDGLGIDTIAVTALDDGSAIICYRQVATGFGLTRVVTAGILEESLLSLSLGTEEQFHPSDTGDSSDICCITASAFDASRAIIFFADNSGGVGRMVSVGIENTSIITNDSLVFRDSPVSNVVSAIADGDTAIVCYKLGGTTGAATAVLLDEDGGISVENNSVFLPSSGTNYLSALTVLRGSPVAVDDAYGTGAGEILTVPAPGLLENDMLPENDAVIVVPHEDRVLGTAGVVTLVSAPIATTTVPPETTTAPPSGPLSAVLVAPPANGTLVLNGDGSFTYVPNDGFIGVDSFSYKASDGKIDSDTAVVVINVDAPPTTTATTTTTTMPPGPRAAPISPTTDTPFETGDVEHLTAVKLDGSPADNRLLLAYRHNSDNRHGKVVTAEVAANGSVIFGPILVFSGSRIEEVLAVGLGTPSGRGAILYRIGTDILARTFRVDLSTTTTTTAPP